MGFNSCLVVHSAYKKTHVCTYVYIRKRRNKFENAQKGYLHFFYFEIGSHCIVQVGLELTITLPGSPRITGMLYIKTFFLFGWLTAFEKGSHVGCTGLKLLNLLPPPLKC